MGGGFGSTQSSGHYLDPARWVGRTLTLKHMLQIKVTACDSCGSLRPAIRDLVYPDSNYIKALTNLRPRSPPVVLPKVAGGANTKVA
jgi:hypothetical protein